MFSKRNVFCACVVGLVLITPAQNAPRSRSKGHSSTKFDQQQTGDYNVQLHLKDFHIVAVLGDGSWGSYGDYDYNYDYSDLTIKPIVSITTGNPQESSSSEAPNSETQKPEAGTQKPNDHPYPIVSPSTTPRASANSSSTATAAEVQSTNAAATTAANVATTTKPQLNDDSEKTTKGATHSTTKKRDIQPTKGPKKEPALQIATENSVEEQDLDHEKKTESSVTNISVIPVENSGETTSNERLPLGEIMHYRKCAGGYARDKQGRCRKIRRTPPIPFGITRFASNLASRFRQATSGETLL